MAGPFDVAALLVHEPLVRALARAVLKGDDRVEDVVQETWLVALKTPPRGTLRSFLGSVARRIALRVRREDRRLARRHAAAPPPPPSVAVSEIAAREEARRDLVSALLALEEPYREALLLRYYEGHPPRVIARQLGVPVETVRTRVRRGLERLRQRLDERHGGRREAWALALAPLVVGGRASAAARHALPAAAIVLAAGVAALALWSGDGVSPASPRSSAVRATAAAPEGGGAVASPPASVGDPGDVRGTLDGPLPAEARAWVRVLDGERALAHEPIAPGPFAVAFAGGELPLTVEFGAEGARRRRFLIADRSADLGVVRLTKALSYGGRVLDAEGRGVPGAAVEAYYPADRRMIGLPARTDGDGRFRIDLDEPAAGAAVNYKLVLSRGEDHAGPYALEEGGWIGDHDIRVEWSRGLAVSLVDDASGRPIAGLACHLAIQGGLPSRNETASTDSDGLLRVPTADWGGALLAIEHREHGRLHQMLSRNGVAAGLNQLRIGRRTIREIAVTVLRADRTPASGVRLEVRGGWLDPEYIAALPEEQARLVRRRGRGLSVQYDGTVDVDGTLRWKNLVPDASRGEFRLQGWVARYRHDGRDIVERAPEAVELGNGDVIVLGDPRRERVLEVAVTEAEVGRAPELRHLGASFGDYWLADADSPRLDRGRIVWRILVPRDHWEEVSFFVDPRGRKRSTLTFPRAEVEDALDHGRPLAIVLPAEGASGRLRVLAPDGTPARDVIVSLAAPRADNAEMRAATDRAGEVAVHDLEPGVQYAAYAYDPRTQRAALLDPWWPDSEPQVITLLKPRPLRFRVVFEDGLPATPGSVSVQVRVRHLGGARWRAPVDAEGWVECPPFVHEAHVLKITARREGPDGAICQRTVTPTDAASGSPVVVAPR